MNRRLIALDLALLALAAVLAWEMRVHGIEGPRPGNAPFSNDPAAHINALSPPPLMPASRPRPEYIDVAQKMLFAKDRNPNVFLMRRLRLRRSPPIPPMPSYYGQMAFGEPIRSSGRVQRRRAEKLSRGRQDRDFQIVGFRSRKNRP